METKDKNNNYKALKNISGILLIIIGIFGLFVPILQGIIFITTGIVILGGKPIAKQLENLKIYLKSKFSKKR